MLALQAWLAAQPVLAALIAIVGISCVFGALLGMAAVIFRPSGNSVVEQINAILPQTQCGQCGYPGCRPYAEAIALGAPINQCPPGGESGIQALAALLDVEPLALDAEHGVEKPRETAFIREAECIGCTKCIQACPVDAIVGAAKLMHTVIANECTGCDLCVAPCPVDCIEMRPLAQGIPAWQWHLPDRHADAELIASDRQPAQHAADHAA